MEIFTYVSFPSHVFYLLGFLLHIVCLNNEILKVETWKRKNTFSFYVTVLLGHIPISMFIQGALCYGYIYVTGLCNPLCPIQSALWWPDMLNSRIFNRAGENISLVLHSPELLVFLRYHIFTVL